MSANQNMQTGAGVGAVQGVYRGAWLGGLVLGLSASCTATEPTEIVGGVNTQIQVPDYIQSVGLVVQVGGTVAYCDAQPVQNGSFELPGTLGVLDGLDDVGGGANLLGQVVTLQVLGLRVGDSRYMSDCFGTPPPEPNTVDGAGNPLDRQTMVIRRRRLTFVDEKILFQNMPLKESCRDTACGENETCVGGVCAPIDIRDSCPIPGVSCGEELPEYKESLAFGSTNTCFNPAACLDGASVPSYLEDPEDCTFVTEWPDGLPAPNADDLNVRVTYDSFGTEILDRDSPLLPAVQQEGFSQPDPGNPLKFRLAPNLCESNYKTGRIVAVESSGYCPGKRALQPICEDYVPKSRRDPARGGLTGMCTMASLEPVESVVSVLMDQSDRMFSYYADGPASISSAIDLPLASPNARQTQISLGLIPAAANLCGTDNYTPAVGFGPVAQARGPIGGVVANPATVLPDDPPAFSLQAALQGTYAALGNAAPLAPGGGVTRRAAIVISNRDVLAGECAGEPSSVELAAQAAAASAPIATYAVALGDGDPLSENVQADAATLDSASQLANAGGTTVYNGVADELEGATAVAEILNELSTCQYNVTRIDLGANTAASLPDNALLSYVDPLDPDPQVVDIPRNLNCSAATELSESGWNAEGDIVRVCGAACTALRDISFRVTAFQYGRERAAPPVPIVASAPCDDTSFRWTNQ